MSISLTDSEISISLNWITYHRGEEVWLDIRATPTYSLLIQYSRDILPVMSTLRHNEFFEGVIDRSGKMTPEFIEELSFVLNTSQSLKKLELTNCAFKP